MGTEILKAYSEEYGSKEKRKKRKPSARKKKALDPLLTFEINAHLLLNKNLQGKAWQRWQSF